jgi:hypothetical protein
VLIQWSWSYLTFARGTRLIVEKEWRFHAPKQQPAKLATGTRPLAEEGAPASSRVARGSSGSVPPSMPIDAPLLASERATVLLPESGPPPPDSDVDEAATGTWASPLDGWDEPTRAYPPVRGT